MDQLFHQHLNRYFILGTEVIGSVDDLNDRSHNSNAEVDQNNNDPCTINYNLNRISQQQAASDDILSQRINNIDLNSNTTPLILLLFELPSFKFIY